MPTLPLNSSVELNYQCSGDDPVAIVLCNGAGVPLTYWGSFAVRLSEVARVIQFDQRNAGATQYEGKFTLGDIAADIIGLLDHLKVDRVIVMGHAWGGRVAQVFARDYPNRVNGLIVCGTGGQFPAVDMHDSLQELGNARRRNDFETWQTHLEALFCANGASTRVPDQFIELTEAMWNSPPSRKARWDGNAFPSKSYWGLCEAATLLIYGEEDKNGTPENANDLHQRIASSRLVMLEQAGHFVVHEQEDRVLQEIKTFLGMLQQ
mgnify:CR=1 FL=1|jgi:pimeloyl-ACP methyl ester carboxylesterase